MKTPTSSAPQIWRKVSRNTCTNSFGLGRMTSNITIQDARIAVPPMKGVKAKETEVVLEVMEATVLTSKLGAATFGNPDQGPVHSTTTTIRIKKGSMAARTERPDAACS